MELVHKKFSTYITLVRFLILTGLYFANSSVADVSHDDWMAAYHQTLVAIDAQRPNAHVGTYINDRFTFVETYQLAKIFSGIEINGQKFEAKDANNIKVTPIAGGVVASYTLGKVKVTTEIVPLLLGRDEIEWQGVALYTISTEPAAIVTARCGEGELAQFPAKEKVVFLRSDDIGIDGDTASIGADGLGILQSKKHPLIVCVNASGKMAVQPGSKGGQILDIRMEQGRGTIVIAFAKDAELAKTLAKPDIQKARKEIGLHYEKLFQTRIETPEKVMDEAFGQALVTLEYTWLKPYGWMECIHHWIAMWHMQASGCAPWIGQADRAKECIVSHAKLLPEEAVPQYVPGGFTHRDFGGSNQYYVWQIQNYLNFTNDKKLAATLAPVLDKVIAQTFKEYDPDNDLLLAWGLQIGNQEDFVGTPYDGTSPVVEGIQMMRTRRDIARDLGDEKTAVEYENRAAIMLDKMKERLWQKDLGRFIYYRDPFDVARLDGQYHSLIYPVIYDCTDPFDGWTCIRQMRDRLVDANGGVYCSANFPNHTCSTWGMQAGAAQQPWGAWGLAKVGLRNETYRPLKYISEYVMNDDHKGSWPEIAAEPAPAYFSPPAGLFIQATVEAMFGLQMHKREGFLQVSPSFPDQWPFAKLTLPEFSANYERKSDTLIYTVESKEPIARHLRWMLPVGDIKQVRINGQKVKYEVTAGVNCIIVTAKTESQNKTCFEVAIQPLKDTPQFTASIAEGDELSVKIPDCKIKKLDDRGGVLSTSQIKDSSLTATINNGLLRPYMVYGRLGQLTFSRRTFFVLCQTLKGTDFWMPIDLTILPRFEAAVVGGMKNDGKLNLLVRNNTASRGKGNSYLRIARQELCLPIDVAARHQSQYEVRLDEKYFALLSPGENKAELLLPDNSLVELKFLAPDIFEIPQVKEYQKERIVMFDLDKNAMKSDELWPQWTVTYSSVPDAWGAPRPLLQELRSGVIEANGIKPFSFNIPERKMIPVSIKGGSPTFKLDITDSRPFKKFYLLVFPLMNNHSMFGPVAQIAVHKEHISTRGDRVIGEDVFVRTVYMPGNIDWFAGEGYVGVFSTVQAQKERNDRFGLLPILDANTSDWQEGKPPQFPQPQYWADCQVFKTPMAVMNIIEVDLGKPAKVLSLSISTVGANSAIGLVAVSGETICGMEKLAGTKYLPPAQFREPIMIFDIKDINSVKDWKFEGDAFSVASVPSLFAEPTLNSLAKSGEVVTGKAISPDFKALPDFKSLSIYCQGGNSAADEGQGLLAIDLVDSKTGQRLERLYIKGAHSLREEKMSLTKAAGKTVHLELVDMNANTSYAWLGIKKVVLEE